MATITRDKWNGFGRITVSNFSGYATYSYIIDVYYYNDSGVWTLLATHDLNPASPDSTYPITGLLERLYYVNIDYVLGSSRVTEGNPNRPTYIDLTPPTINCTKTVNYGGYLHWSISATDTSGVASVWTNLKMGSSSVTTNQITTTPAFTSREVSGLSAGTYTIEASSTDNIFGNHTGVSNTDSYTFPDIPPAPTVSNPTRSASNQVITLSLPSFSGTTGAGARYNVRASWTGYDSGWIDTDSTSWTAPSNPPINTTVTFEVKAENYTGKSGVTSKTITSWVGPNAPNTPTLSNITDTSLTVNWSGGGGQSGGLTSYRFQMHRQNGSNWDLVTNVDVGSAITRDITGLSSNNTYKFTVIANDSGGFSNSSFVTVTTRSSEFVCRSASFSFDPQKRVYPRFSKRKYPKDK